MCFTPECRLTRIYNQGNEAFSKSRIRERCASRSRRIREIRQRTLQLRQGNNPCCVQTDAVILDYQGAIRTGIEPALSEYKSAVCQNEPSIAVDTFIYFSRHHFTVGFEPTTSRSNPGRYTKLSHSTIAVGAFVDRLPPSGLQSQCLEGLWRTQRSPVTMSGVTLIVCQIRPASDSPTHKAGEYSSVCFGTKLPVNANQTRVGIIIALFNNVKYDLKSTALPPKAVLNPQLYEWLSIVRPPTARRRTGDHLQYLQVILTTTPVGSLGDRYHLQVHHTLQIAENRGKKVANPDFYVWIRKFFCFSSRSVSFFTKSSGKTTFKTGPKDKTRIKSSVSSSFS